MPTGCLNGKYLITKDNKLYCLTNQTNMFAPPINVLLFNIAGTYTIKKPEIKQRMIVKVVGAGGHGGSDGGITNYGGRGGYGCLVVKVYEGEEYDALPDEITLTVGGVTSGLGQTSSFNGDEIIAEGGRRGGDAGFGYHGSVGANGNGSGGEVFVGSDAADRTFFGTEYGKAGQRQANGTTGCVYIDIQ